MGNSYPVFEQEVQSDKDINIRTESKSKDEQVHKSLEQKVFCAERHQRGRERRRYNKKKYKVQPIDIPGAVASVEP